MKKKVLAVGLAAGLLFSGIAVQAAETSSCPHVSLGSVTSTKVVGGYNHSYTTSTGTKGCAVTIKQDTTTFTCTACGEIVDVVVGQKYEVHSTNHR